MGQRQDNFFVKKDDMEFNTCLGRTLVWPWYGRIEITLPLGHCVLWVANCLLSFQNLGD